MSDVALTVAGLYVHPVKSCSAVSLTESLLIETGLEFDRTWMVVDPDGRFVTQRELPRMALVQVTLKHSELVLRAPGMLALHIALDEVDQPTQATVWDDTVKAYDMGELPAQWFSTFLGQPVRLVRFDPDQRRLSSTRWTGDIEAENTFSDGYPVLVISQASLDDLNARLAARSLDPVTMVRFRPNLVLGGLEAHDEDHLDEIRIDTDEGPVRLKLVKPCARCSIPSVDPATGEQGTEPSDTLAGYRADPRLDGAITFGMNAVIVEGVERALRVGQTGEGDYRFD